MAKLELSSIGKEEEASAPSMERIEVRPWYFGGKTNQMFLIGGGANFRATANIWLEIIYSVNDVPFFYTRNFLHFMTDIFSISERETWLDKFSRGEQDSFAFGDMLPETSIELVRERYQYQDVNHQEQTAFHYALVVGIDAGAVIARSSPGMHMINIKIMDVELEQGVQFMRDLIHEIGEVYEGKHPNPAELPQGSGNWHFVRQLNQKAYDRISEHYEEHYFSNPLLTEAFDGWLNELPPGGHILDAGCGHGQPVISRLLEKGCAVTGADLSPKMLEKARQNFPAVQFVNQMTSEISYESEFDGACSLSSLLYLDPIDLSHSIYRLYHALKPGGLLFLYAYEQDPGVRGDPYHAEIHEWMWSWTYSMQEAVQALEEHGFFQVLKMQDVSTPEEKQEWIESWRKSLEKQKQQNEEMHKSAPPPAEASHGLANLQLPSYFSDHDPSKPPQNLAYSYIIVARREKG